MQGFAAMEIEESSKKIKFPIVKDLPKEYETSPLGECRSIYSSDGVFIDIDDVVNTYLMLQTYMVKMKQKVEADLIDFLIRELREIKEGIIGQ